MKNKKIIVIVSLIALVLVLSIFFVLRHLNSDSRSIERTYSSITWPSYLTLTDKRSEDDRKYDPQLKFLWKYTYAIKSNLSHERIREDVQNSLQKQGYGAIMDYKAAPPDQYNFTAEGKGLHLTVIVGDKNDLDNNDTVLVTAKVSD